jgi:hypothetical protein
VRELPNSETQDTLKLRIPRAYLINSRDWSGGRGHVITVKAHLPDLVRDQVRHKLSPGMQVTAEMNLGSRTVLEYLLSPVQKTVHEAGRER